MTKLPPFELFMRDGYYWVRFSYYDSTAKQTVVKEESTKIQDQEYLKTRALKQAKNIVKRKQHNGQILAFSEWGNGVQSTWEDGSSSQNSENTMNLIRIRKNKIYLDFYYTDPKTGLQERCQKSTGLDDSFEARIKAQQLALEHRKVLSQLNPPSTLLKGIIFSKSRESTVTNFEGIFVTYQSDALWTDLTYDSKVLYERMWRLHISPFFAKHSLQHIDLQTVKLFRSYLSSLEKKQGEKSIPYGGKYRNQVLGLLKILLRFAFQNGFLTEFKLDKNHIKPFPESPPQVNALSPEERDIFLAYVEKHEPFYYPVLCFTAYTGVRYGECRAVFCKHVNIIAQTVTIKQSMGGNGSLKPTKTREPRTLYLTDELVEMLKQMNLEKKRGTDFLFVGKNGKPFSKSRLTKVVKRCAKRAGLKHITMHSLRHTCASAIANKHGIVLAQRTLGHSDVRTTQAYYHIDQDTFKKAMKNQ